MINVILADHQRIFRLGMAAALAAEEDIRIVGQPHSIAQLMHGLERLRPQVLVLSTAYQKQLDAIRQLCDSQRTAILLLEDHEDTQTEQFASTVKGVMQRSDNELTVVRCIRHVARGGRVLRLVRNHAMDAGQDPIGIRVRQRLTAHELRIISMVVQGFRNREIAVRTGTAEYSVKNALRRIFDKTGVFDRLELALYVLHHRALTQAVKDVTPNRDIGPMATGHPEWWASRRTAVN